MKLLTKEKYRMIMMMHTLIDTYNQISMSQDVTLLQAICKENNNSSNQVMKVTL